MKSLSESHSALSPWREETLLPSGKEFFDSLEKGIQSAKHSIELENYIFQSDNIGQKIAASLIAASSRGVKIRVLVDGVGSQGWIFTIGALLSANGIQIKVYHQLPWERLFTSDPRWEVSPSWTNLFRFLNRRDHRKICIIDGDRGWIGSMNIWDVTLQGTSGSPPWREMGIFVSGDSIKFFQAAFEMAWYPPLPKYKKKRKLCQQLVTESDSTFVRLNSTLGLRFKLYGSLIARIQNAKKRIWIANAYFVPARSLIAVLSAAAKRGVDVRVLISSQSDVFFMPWVAAAFQIALIEAGVKIYGYQPGIFHAKYMLIDDWGMLGSTNLNQRSLIHDLEADVATESSTTLKGMSNEFEKDISSSVLLGEEALIARPWWEKALGKIALLFKYFL